MTLEDKAKFVSENNYKGLAFQVSEKSGLAYKTCQKYAGNPFAQTAKCFLFVNAAYDVIKEVKAQNVL